MPSTGHAPPPSRPADFKGGVDYWATQPASLDGVLGGYGRLTQKDSLSSRMFLLTVLPRLSTVSMHNPAATHPTQIQVEKHRTRALDVGSGIGRVTANVLLPLVDSVDLVEPVEHFLKEALRAAQEKEWKALQRHTEQDKRLRFYKQGLQHFNPEKPDEDACIGSVGPAEDDGQMGYDVIWCQWCLGHLSDDQLTEWLKACKRALRKPDSVIVIKENVTHPNSLREYDAQDRSWTRSCKVWKDLFAKADLKIVREEEQKGFPRELFAVWMYALR